MPLLLVKDDVESALAFPLAADIGGRGLVGVGCGNGRSSGGAAGQEQEEE